MRLARMMCLTALCSLVFAVVQAAGTPIHLENPRVLSLPNGVSYGEEAEAIGDSAYVTAWSDNGGPSYISEIDLASGQVVRDLPYTLWTQMGKRLLVMGKAGKGFYYQYYLDPRTGKTERVRCDELFGGDNRKGVKVAWFSALLPYMNDRYFGLKQPENGPRSLVCIDVRKGTLERLTAEASDLRGGALGEPYAIAPDRMHLLVGDGAGGLLVWNIVAKAPVGRVPLATNSPMRWRFAYFLSSQFFLIPDEGLEGNTFSVYHLYPGGEDPIALYDTLTFAVGRKMDALWFTPDFSRAIVHYADQTEPSAYVYDSPELVEYAGSCAERGRTGEVNDSRVRIREYPSLQGEILGVTDEDPHVFVLEASSLKMRIGEREDFWYKVRLSTGQVGWIFGGFFSPDW